MKITRVRAVSHKVQNVMTGWKTSLGGSDTHELIFVRIDTDEKFFGDRKSTRLNSSHIQKSRMPSSA